MNLSLRNRISLLYVVATAVMTLLLFVTVYVVVSDTVYHHLDSDLDAESQEVFNNLVILNKQFIFANPFEWGEREHGQIEVNPIFIEILDSNGVLLKQTKNLNKIRLEFHPEFNKKTYFNTSLSGSPTRQLQMPIKNPTGNILGYIVISIPLEESALVLENLRFVLITAFPLVLLALYLISRFIAGKSISPINKVINTAEEITRESIDKRIELPQHKDEIYKLTSTINDLLNRLEDAVLREKQFTSDASHELRTPLAIIKGTLEVLIRRPREVEHYEAQINYCLDEVDRMSKLVDQLLMLARFESGKITPNISKVNLIESIMNVTARELDNSPSRKIKFLFDENKDVIVNADNSMLEAILSNILSNSIKYSAEGKPVEISLEQNSLNVVCSIKDYGIGMSKNQVEKIFDRFYRADESRTSEVDGNGLGLSIVKKIADLQNIKLNIESSPGEGTTFNIHFEK